MSRREFPAKVKLAAFKRAADRCERCAAPLLPGRFDYDHVIPDAMVLLLSRTLVRPALRRRSGFRLWLRSAHLLAALRQGAPSRESPDPERFQPAGH